MNANYELQKIRSEVKILSDFIQNLPEIESMNNQVKPSICNDNERVMPLRDNVQTLFKHKLTNV